MQAKPFTSFSREVTAASPQVFAHGREVPESLRQGIWRIFFRFVCRNLVGKVLEDAAHFSSLVMVTAPLSTLRWVREIQLVVVGVSRFRGYAVSFVARFRLSLATERRRFRSREMRLSCFND